MVWRGSWRETELVSYLGEEGRSTRGGKGGAGRGEEQSGIGENRVIPVGSRRYYTSGQMRAKQDESRGGCDEKGCVDGRGRNA